MVEFLTGEVRAIEKRAQGVRSWIEFDENGVSRLYVLKELPLGTKVGVTVEYSVTSAPGRGAYPASQ
jgi:hypothetical protein